MKNKTSLRNKILMGTTAIGLILSGASCDNSDRIITKPLTYQGFNVDEGRKILVFDNQPKQSREGPAELRAYGYGTDTLKIGEEYDVGYIPSGRKGVPGKIKNTNYPSMNSK